MSPQVVKAEQQNFHEILAGIQDSDWKGHFSLKLRGLGLGLLDLGCSGPIVVKFFPQQEETFSNGAQSVSYRHDADFTHNLNPLCDIIGKHFSVVDVGQCTSIFPMKYNPEENTEVPFRTIIPTSDGGRAFVNSPACSKDSKTGVQTIERSQFEITSAVLSKDHQSLDLTINIVLGQLKAPVRYILTRQTAPIFSPQKP